MTELELTRDLRLALKARAHHLEPVVLLGAQGLTEAVLKEIDRALLAHELIKVRVPLEERDRREEVFTQIAQRLAAARIVHIGKLVVLFRPQPEAEQPAASAPGRGRAAAGTAPSSRRATLSKQNVGVGRVTERGKILGARDSGAHRADPSSRRGARGRGR